MNNTAAPERDPSARARAHTHTHTRMSTDTHSNPIRSQRNLTAARSLEGRRERGWIGAHHSMATERVLITFDVDGTLMQSTGLQANLLHKKAFSHAFLQVFGVEGTIDAIKHHGSTDPLVILNTLEHYGIPQETAAPKLGELKAKMVEYAMQHASEVGEGLEVLPGVRNLLEVLARHDEVVVGLVTGNLEDIAWLKMEGLGIRQFFSVPNFGGFGSDHTDRGELVRIAAARADQLFPGGFRLHAHVGDTPNDIRASEFGGALAIGVCTGIFTQKDLREASHSSTPAVILDNLQNVMNFINILGLRSRDF